jgi:hypothetical protein
MSLLIHKKNNQLHEIIYNSCESTSKISIKFVIISFVISIFVYFKKIQNSKKYFFFNKFS